MPLARADLESLLRTRQLDRTLTTALPVATPSQDPDASAATGVDALDARLGGGLPRGQISELVGPRSSGRTSLMLQMLTAATARGEIVALVDALDTLDVESAAEAGIDLDRLLWVRGHVVPNPGLCRDMNQRAMEQAVRALALILQAGNFGLVVFDVADAPADAVRRLPFTTWLRLQRIVEGSQTTCLLVGSEAMARSAAGLSLRARAGVRDQGLRAGIREQGLGIREIAESTEQLRTGIRFGDRLFEGLDMETRVVRARIRAHEDATVAVRTIAANCA